MLKIYVQAQPSRFRLVIVLRVMVRLFCFSPNNVIIYDFDHKRDISTTPHEYVKNELAFKVHNSTV